MTQHDRARRLIEYLYGIESRVTDLEQGRPGEVAARQVETVSETMYQSDSVSDEARTDFVAEWDTPAQGWNRTQWADETGGI